MQNDVIRYLLQGKKNCPVSKYVPLGSREVLQTFHYPFRHNQHKR